MKKILILFLIILSIYNFGQITLNERFDSNKNFTTMYGWSGNVEKVYPSSSTCVSSLSLTNIPAPDNINNVIYTTNHSNGTALNYSFKYFIPSYPANISGAITIAYSIDGGSTWTNVGNVISVGAPTFCSTVSGIIPADIIPVGADFKFRIQIKNTMVSNSSNFRIYIDDIKLEQTIFSIPSCSNIYNPSNVNTVFGQYDYFQWSPAAGATGYYLSLGTTPNGTDILNNINVGHKTEWPSPSSLKYSTQYFVTVVPYNSFGNASCNMSGSFTTRSIPCPTLTVQDGYTFYDPYTYMFWAQVGQATGYKITLGTTPNGAEVYDNLDVGNVDHFLIPIGLLFNTTYYVQIKAYNNESISTGCNVTQFTRNRPCAPLLELGPSGDHVSLTPTIYWGPNPKVIPTGGYRLSVGKYVGTTGNINNILDNFDVGNTNTYHISTPLELNTKYFYKVEAYNYPSEHYNSCPINTFTTTSSSLSTLELQKNKNDINLYPNPTKDFIVIDARNKIKNVNIVDFSGRKLRQLKLDNNKVDLRDLASGNYILQIQFSDDSFYTKTIMKE